MKILVEIAPQPETPGHIQQKPGHAGVNQIEEDAAVAVVAREHVPQGPATPVAIARQRCFVGQGPQPEPAQGRYPAGEIPGAEEQPAKKVVQRNQPAQGGVMTPEMGRADAVVNRHVGRLATRLKGGADAIFVEASGGSVAHGHEAIGVVTVGHGDGNARLAAAQLPVVVTPGGGRKMLDHVQAQVLPEQADAGLRALGHHRPKNQPL